MDHIPGVSIHLLEAMIREDGLNIDAIGRIDGVPQDQMDDDALAEFAGMHFAATYIVNVNRTIHHLRGFPESLIEEVAMGSPRKACNNLERFDPEEFFSLPNTPILRRFSKKKADAYIFLELFAAQKELDEDLEKNSLDVDNLNKAPVDREALNLDDSDSIQEHANPVINPIYQIAIKALNQEEEILKALGNLKNEKLKKHIRETLLPQIQETLKAIKKEISTQVYEDIVFIASHENSTEELTNLMEKIVDFFRNSEAHPFVNDVKHTLQRAKSPNILTLFDQKVDVLIDYATR